ncbi:MAG: hypothetical protein ACC661_02620 [Verrucomicrobiales bacterium]
MNSPLRNQIGVLALGMAAAALFTADAEPGGVELPTWDERDATRYAEPGSTILGRGLWPVEVLPHPEVLLKQLREEREALERESQTGGSLPELEELEPMVVQVPDLSIPRQLRAEEFNRDLKGEVPEGFRAAYFSAPPAGFLVDPQHLLGEQKTNDLRRFLEYHDGESRFTVYVLVFGSRQRLPDGVEMGDLHRHWFGDEPVVLLSFFLGDPKRALIEFGDRMSAEIGAETVAEVFESCVAEGLVARNAFHQMERFCIELSIRLYWVEKSNFLPVAEPGDGGLTAATRASRPISVGRAWAWIGATLGAVALLVAALLGIRIWLGRRGRTYLFPEYELVPRLSAPHSGGAHAVMYFGRRGG